MNVSLVVVIVFFVNLVIGLTGCIGFGFTFNKKYETLFFAITIGACMGMLLIAGIALLFKELNMM